MPKKGNIPWNKGKKSVQVAWNKGLKMPSLTDERKSKISKSLKGIKRSEKTRLKMSASGKGKIISEEARKKMSLAKKGKRLSEETRKKMSIAKSGSNSPSWKGGVTSESHRIRSSSEWRRWRELVFKRDNYMCRECLEVGVYIEPHHIVPVRSDKSKLFNTSNGITLCRPCHRKTMWKESSFAEKYSLLVAA